LFEGKCLLSKDGKSLCTSAVYDCDKCGWAADVERRRKDYARRYGLREGKDGLRYIPARPGTE
jgi:hypothetical protein